MAPNEKAIDAHQAANVVNIFIPVFVSGQPLDQNVRIIHKKKSQKYLQIKYNLIYVDNVNI